MDEYQSLNHSQWECKYHVVFIPKCRRKVLFGELRRHLGPVLRTLTEQKESRIEEGALMPDQVRGVACDRLHQGEERHPHRQDVRRSEAQLRGPALLGARILRLDGRSRRGSDPRVHPQPGTRGQENRPAVATEVDPPPSGGSKRRSCAAPTTAALGGSLSA